MADQEAWAICYRRAVEVVVAVILAVKRGGIQIRSHLHMSRQLAQLAVLQVLARLHQQLEVVLGKMV